MSRVLFVYKKATFAKLRQRIDEDMADRGPFFTTESRISEGAVTEVVAAHLSVDES
jgi:hypothetical protein